MNAVFSQLLAAFVYPRTLDDYIELAFPLHSSRHLRARVLSVRRETEDVATLVLKPNALWHGHRAGQYVALTVEIDGARRTRCFSIASAEGAEHLAITVKARPGGLVTPALVSGDLRGAIVELSQATGDFVLPSPMPPRTLFVSGGSGITPVMSMLRTLTRRGYAGELTFVHYARSEADVIFRDELAMLARTAPPNLRVHIFTGPFDAGGFAERVPSFEHCDTWACGPEPFLEAVGRAFADVGAQRRVRVERYSLFPSPASGRTEAEVTFVKTKKRVLAAGPLLATAENAGLTPPSGCRMGICRTCLCRKVAGVTRDVRTGELSTDAGVDIQLCVSEPIGPVTLDL